jgi:hypothetical protein
MAEKLLLVLSSFIFLVFQRSVTVDSAPVSSDSKSSAFYYLLNYGYIHKSENGDTAQILSEEAVTKAVKDFQVGTIKELFKMYYCFVLNLLNRTVLHAIMKKISRNNCCDFNSLISYHFDDCELSYFFLKLIFYVK